MAIIKKFRIKTFKKQKPKIDLKNILKQWDGMILIG